MLLALLLAPATPTPGVRALTVDVGQFQCPERSLEVMITNPDPDRPQTYVLALDGKALRSEQIDPDSAVSSSVERSADGTSTIAVTEDRTTLARTTRTAACSARSSAPSLGRTAMSAPGDTAPPSPGDISTPAPGRTAAPASGRGQARPPGASGRLPFTGGGDHLTARAATALGIMVFGGLLLFYAILWPREGSGDWSSPIRRSR